MSTETKRIRTACLKRSEGACESCGREGDLHLDHFFGRGAGRNGNTVETCWMLCVNCDYQKTNNQPTAAWWLALFAAHCERYGFSDEAERTRARIQALEAKGLA